MTGEVTIFGETIFTATTGLALSHLLMVSFFTKFKTSEHFVEETETLKPPL